VALYKHARRAHWDVADWASPSGATRALDPAGGRQ
jgi:fatty acyl-CoA reductase